MGNEQFVKLNKVKEGKAVPALLQRLCDSHVWAQIGYPMAAALRGGCAGAVCGTAFRPELSDGRRTPGTFVSWGRKGVLLFSSAFPWMRQDHGSFAQAKFLCSIYHLFQADMLFLCSCLCYEIAEGRNCADGFKRASFWKAGAVAEVRHAVGHTAAPVPAVGKCPIMQCADTIQWLMAE